MQGPRPNRRSCHVAVMGARGGLGCPIVCARGGSSFFVRDGISALRWLGSAADGGDAAVVSGVRPGEYGPGMAPLRRGTTGHKVMATRRVATAVLLGGFLWILYGPFSMLQPWGADVAYREAKGYSEVVDTPLFLVYSLPGALALVLNAAGLLGITVRLPERGRTLQTVTRGLIYLALGLGLISLAGVVALFDPGFTAGRIFGTLSLGAAALLASEAARRGGAATTWVRALSLLGAVGIFLLPLWPLVYALQWLPEAAGALVIAVFGVGWMWAGWRLWEEAGGAAVSDKGHDEAQ